MPFFLLIVGILLFVMLVLVHEFGHFIMAKRNNVDVEEFGLFFPPRLFKHKTKAGWNFTINALPLGGFVKLKGEYDSDTEKGSFGAASIWVKFKIMVAGVTMNLITALVLFTILALIGIPQIFPNQYTVKSDTKITNAGVLLNEVLPDSPASRAGLKVDDEITAMGQAGHSMVKITSADQLSSFTDKYAGKTIDIAYKSEDGTAKTTQATLLTNQAVNASLKTNNPKAHLGVRPIGYQVQHSTWAAPIVAVGLSAQLTSLTFQGIGHALGGLGSTIAGAVTGNKAARQHGQTNATAEVTGPVGIFEMLKSSSMIGYQVVLALIAYISLVLAIMNILPIPALDGGKLWFTLIPRALKRPLSAKKEEIINITGLIIILTLFILITIVDVKRY